MLLVFLNVKFCPEGQQVLSFYTQESRSLKSEREREREMGKIGKGGADGMVSYGQQYWREEGDVAGGWESEM